MVLQFSNEVCVQESSATPSCWRKLQLPLHALFHPAEGLIRLFISWQQIKQETVGNLDNIILWCQNCMFTETFLILVLGADIGEDFIQ
jgi:succinate dehydrogenase/fumarate reductase cytochrome b subunit